MVETYRITKIDKENNYTIKRISPKDSWIRKLVSFDYDDIEQKISTMRVGESFDEIV